MSTSTPPSTARLFLELCASLPRLMQGMDIRSTTTARNPSMDPVIIRARVVWMYAAETHMMLQSQHRPPEDVSESRKKKKNNAK